MGTNAAQVVAEDVVVLSVASFLVVLQSVAPVQLKKRVHQWHKLRAKFRRRMLLHHLRQRRGARMVS
jgi:hypothetical protein